MVSQTLRRETTGSSAIRDVETRTRAFPAEDPDLDRSNPTTLYLFHHIEENQYAEVETSDRGPAPH